MCHKVASLHCLHSGMTHHITLHTSYLYFLIPTLNLSNKFEMMRVDWESLKVSSCTLNTPHHNISQQLRSGQRNYTTTLFTLCRKIFASVLDKIFLHWIFCTVCHIPHVLSNAHPCQAAGAGQGITITRHQTKLPQLRQERCERSIGDPVILLLHIGLKGKIQITLFVTETESLFKKKFWGRTKISQFYKSHLWVWKKTSMDGQ